MLVNDRLSRQKNTGVKVPEKNTLTSSKTLKSFNKSPRLLARKTRQNSTPNQEAKSHYDNYPMWLKSLILFSHGSSIACFLTVAVGFVMYGLTVYAPTQWTSKYKHLQELQKQERQFSFTQEVLKNELAESAKNGNSGLVNPDATQPPIFLPDTTPKPIELNNKPTPDPKKVQKITPIAY